MEKKKNSREWGEYSRWIDVGPCGRFCICIFENFLIQRRSSEVFTGLKHRAVLYRTIGQRAVCV
jgi:hypothetical protein